MIYHFLTPKADAWRSPIVVAVNQTGEAQSFPDSPPRYPADLLPSWAPSLWEGSTGASRQIKLLVQHGIGFISQNS